MNLRIYCQFEVLDWILLCEDDIESASVLRKLLEDHADVILDITDEEVLQKEIQNDFLKQLRKRGGKELICIPGFLEQINQDSVDGFCRDIIVVDEEEHAKSLNEHFGILAISKDNFNRFDPYASLIYSKRIQSTNKYIHDDLKGWAYLLDKVPKLSANSMVIIDNHLFKTQTECNRQDDNLKEILRIIIQKSLRIPFHLTILVKYSDYLVEKEDEVYKVEALRNSYIQLLSDLGLMDPEVEIIIHNRDGKDVHDRYLIAGHYHIAIGYGFNIFNKETGLKNTTLNIIGNYMQIDSSKGDYTYKMVWQELESQKELFSKFSQSKLENGTEREFFYKGPINNRIF